MSAASGSLTKRFAQMNRLIHIVVLLVIAASMSGCTTAHWTDRERDTADIFTCTVGMGAGASVKAGPLHAGMIFSAGNWGLRGGEWGGTHGEPRSGELDFLLFPTPNSSGRQAENVIHWGSDVHIPDGGGTAEKRGKTYLDDLEARKEEEIQKARRF